MSPAAPPLLDWGVALDEYEACLRRYQQALGAGTGPTASGSPRFVPPTGVGVPRGPDLERARALLARSDELERQLVAALSDLGRQLGRPDHRSSERPGASFVDTRA